jgi:hypothetical protein
LTSPVSVTPIIGSTHKHHVVPSPTPIALGRRSRSIWRHAAHARFVLTSRSIAPRLDKLSQLCHTARIWCGTRRAWDARDEWERLHAERCCWERRRCRVWHVGDGHAG